MTTALQLRRGTTAQHSTFTGLNGEVTADTTLKTLRVHDGATVGGFPLAKLSDITTAVRYDVAQTLTSPQKLQARSNIAALLEPASNGIVVKTAAGTTASRALVAGTGISITNTDGVSGNVTISCTVSSGVTSVNGNAGEITAEQVAAAAVTGLGYTPANAAVAGTDHTHSGYVSSNSVHGAVGSFVLATIAPFSLSSGKTSGSTIAGSSLKPCGIQINATGLNLGTTLSGTWRLFAPASFDSNAIGCAVLCQRIS